MTLEEVMTQLKALGDEKLRKIYAGRGAGDNHYGVKSADLRSLAKQLKAEPDLAAALWKTGNVDAMSLATLLMKPKQLSAAEVEQMVCSVTYVQVADWL